MTNEYGIPVSTRSEPLSQKCYVEWQVGYDVLKSDKEKLSKTTLPDKIFIGANGKEKSLYELSEYIKYFYDWNIITKESLLKIKEFLQQLNKNSFLEVNEALTIKRTHPIEKEINGFNFSFSKVEYPILIYHFGKFDIISEIIIKEKQYAIGTQPMLFLCFPITELDNSDKLLGRISESKEKATFTITKNNISVFIEMLKLFGTLSYKHNHDVVEILNVILDD